VEEKHQRQNKQTGENKKNNDLIISVTVNIQSKQKVVYRRMTSFLCRFGSMSVWGHEVVTYTKISLKQFENNWKKSSFYKKYFISYSGTISIALYT
jgi:hypothetical protein